MEQQDLNKVLNEAADRTNGDVTYATTARFTITTTELFLDLYMIAPNSADITQLEARRLHRIAIPLSVAKDLSGKILVGIQHWENEYGINLPLETTRQISKEDN